MENVLAASALSITQSVIFITVFAIWNKIKPFSFPFGPFQLFSTFILYFFMQLTIELLDMNLKEVFFSLTIFAVVTLGIAAVRGPTIVKGEGSWREFRSKIVQKVRQSDFDWSLTLCGVCAFVSAALLITTLR